MVPSTTSPEILDGPVGEDPVDVKQGNILTPRQRRAGCVEDVFPFWAPRVSPSTSHGGNDAAGDEVPPIGRGAKWVERDWIVLVGRVEIQDVICAPGRNEVEKFVGEVAMRVNDPDPLDVGPVWTQFVVRKNRF